MNEELAKELKDAGFSQDYTVLESSLKGLSEEGKRAYKAGLQPRVPTLEELIEACGSEFTTLQNYASKGWGAFALKNFVTANNNKRTKELQEHGSTPTEAVARLWLSLHKQA